jgi:hypothetical protein
MHPEVETPEVETQPVEPRPVCTWTLTKAEAQALVDAYGIPQGTMEQEEFQLLQKTNPDLLGARTTLECLRLYGKQTWGWRNKP